MDQFYSQCHPDYETQSGKLPAFDNFWLLWFTLRYNAESFTTFTVAYFIRAQESEGSFTERERILKYLLRKIITTIRYKNNSLKKSFEEIADNLYQAWIKTKQFQSWEVESISSNSSTISIDISTGSESMTSENQDDTIIIPAGGSDENSPNTRLPTMADQPPSGTTTPIITSNPYEYSTQTWYDEDDEEETYTQRDIGFGYFNDDDENMQGTSFFNNAGVIKSGRMPNRISRQVSFNPVISSTSTRTSYQPVTTTSSNNQLTSTESSRNNNLPNT